MDPLRLKETCLYVKDLEATATFYEGKLGLPKFSFFDGSHVFFRVESCVLLCFMNSATKQKTALPPHYAEGNMHFAFDTTKAAYDQWRQKVVDAGIEIEHDHTWPGGFRSFYFRDPDQHLVEILEDGMWEYKG